MEINDIEILGTLTSEEVGENDGLDVFEEKILVSDLGKSLLALGYKVIDGEIEEDDGDTYYLRLVFGKE